MKTVVALVLVASASVLGTVQPAGHPSIGQPPGAAAPAAPPEPKAEDVASIDAIVTAFYTSTSGTADRPRDWDRLHSLFVPDGRFCAARPGPEGGAGVLIMPVADYIGYNRKYFEKGGFAEQEIARRVEEFGNMAHVWSTYESRHKPEDAEPYSRGIYSIQLLKSGAAWRVVNVYWDFERPDAPIPARYLPAANP